MRQRRMTEVKWQTGRVPNRSEAKLQIGPLSARLFLPKSVIRLKDLADCTCMRTFARNYPDARLTRPQCCYALVVMEELNANGKTEIVQFLSIRRKLLDGSITA